MEITEILRSDDGPEKTAALVTWVQGQSQPDATTPILVGGAAVELYTSGAYTTGDLDFVGTVTPSLEGALRAAGFERHGRHWIHESAQVFIEFPGTTLGAGEQASWVQAAGHTVFLVSVEDLLVDRLGAWQYWRSTVDGANAWLLWRAHRDHLDRRRLEDRVHEAGWDAALEGLKEFGERWTDTDPSEEELAAWATAGPARR